MRRVLEPLAFLGLATAVHAGVWIGFGGAAAPGAGDGGGASLTLEAAGPELAALVRRWDAPPQPADVAPVAPAAPRMPEPPAAMPRTATIPMPRPPEMPNAPVPSALADAPPEVETATAPAPVPVRPKPRPERREPQASVAKAAPQPGPEQPRQRAAGAGAERTAGQAGTGVASAPSPGQLRALEAEWGAKILARIARHQRYPAGDHGAGTARVTLTVGRDGRLRAVGLAGSSGSAALDRAALDAVRRAGRFAAAPAGLTQAGYTFRVPMTFRRN